MRIAQLSDLHFSESADLRRPGLKGGEHSIPVREPQSPQDNSLARRVFMQGRVQSDIALDAALAAILALDPKPDLLLISGDLAENGSGEEYMGLRQRFAGCALPILAVPGNHDDAALMRDILSPYVPAREVGHSAYVVDAYPLTVIGLDTTWPGHIEGHLDAAQLAWLQRTLSERRERPILIVMHHPPIVTGLAAMDAYRLFDGAEALAGLLKRHVQTVVGILCGHVHRNAHGCFAGVPTYICPAPVHQMAFDLRVGVPLALCLEPPQYAVHQWLPAQGIVSHAVYVQAFPRQEIA
ncbi:MAG: metallophosphoesterase [Betaproteobacteria bacterium]|nr:metallophosphoesterase [Betaproteobacteria bacterium]